MISHPTSVFRWLLWSLLPLVIQSRRTATILRMQSSGGRGLSSQLAQELKRMHSIEENRDISRVITCWDNFVDGKKLHTFVGGNPEIEQQADCFIDGLHATPFHDITPTSKLKWAIDLQNKSDIIGKEVSSIIFLLTSKFNKLSNFFHDVLFFLCNCFS